MTRPAVLVLLCICILASVAAAHGQTNSKTLNGKDGVQITKITPRTQAEIPLPVSNFVFSLEVQAKIVTTPTARVSIRFYRYSPKSLTHLVPVAPAIEKTIAAGKVVRWTMQSAPFSLAGVQAEDRLYVKAYLLDARGKMVSWSDSVNTLRGEVVIKPGGGKAVADRIRALPGTTPPNTALAVNGSSSFVFRLRYDVKSSERGVISVEFGELKDVRAGTPWSVSVIQVPAGTGEVEIRRTFPVAASLKGVKMTIAVALRNDPLSGATSRLELQPYPIGM